MTPERYQQVGQIYRAALELESDQQAVYLAEACAGDESLRQEVESLLGYQAQNGGLIDQPILEAAARAMAKNQAGSPVQSSVGQIVGHYRMISLLGKGGMGEVWLAKDTLLGRKIAIKLLPAEFTADAEQGAPLRPGSARRFRSQPSQHHYHSRDRGNREYPLHCH